MYVPDSEPLWAKCSTPFCKNRDLYDRLQPVGMSDRESGDPPRFCKKCLQEMSEEALADMREDDEHSRILRLMHERNLKLIDAHGDLFHIEDESRMHIAGRVGGPVVEEMEKRKYIVSFRHAHAARAFELTDFGRSVAEQAAAWETRKAQMVAQGRWPIPPGSRRH